MERESLQEWMKKIDKILDKNIGMRWDELPEVDHLGMYDQGKSPLFVARAIMREAALRWK